MNRSVEGNSGRNPTAKELAEAKRIAALDKGEQRRHPAANQADASKLGHINTYGSLPEFYIDKPFRCRDCGKEEIWKAADQKWFYEEAKAHMDATAVRCHDCRKARKGGSG
jgi:Probable zinc-ribbon domain